MNTTSNAMSPRTLIDPVGWIGRSVLSAMGYVGGVMLLACGAAASLLRTDKDQSDPLPGFFKTMVRQLSWMLTIGFPLIGLVHIAMGSFLSMQAYYGSTFVDGTGAVVGVGLLRNLGGLMTGMSLSGILAARMIPELHRLLRHAGRVSTEPHGDGTGPRWGAWRSPIGMNRIAAPRIAAAGVACLLLSQWGIAVGIVVGWQASQSMMGLSTETFFLMMLRMMWFRDVVGLIIKGLLFGILPASICCYEGLREGARPEEPEPPGDGAMHPALGVVPPLATPVFRATLLGILAILLVNLSWFVLVYHAVPFYGPTLLKPPSP